jgi:hypothetical protein
MPRVLHQWEFPTNESLCQSVPVKEATHASKSRGSAPSSPGLVPSLKWTAILGDHSKAAILSVAGFEVMMYGQF